MEFVQFLTMANSLGTISTLYSTNQTTKLVQLSFTDGYNRFQRITQYFPFRRQGEEHWSISVEIWKQNINLCLLLFRRSNFQLVVSPTCARKQLKSILNPQGRKTPKALMKRNEIGKQVLIFSKIILNKFFFDHVSSCDCFPFLLLL